MTEFDKSISARERREYQNNDGWPFRYLNARNPDIQTALRSHAAQIAAGRAGNTWEDWDKLERELMRRYILSDYTPDYQYPFFIQINLPAPRKLWENYMKEIGCRPGAAPSDPERREFERRVAAIVTGGTI